jgi:hypothetical protein
MVLLNPWVRSENSIARTRVKYYYGRRFLQKEFWEKLAGGRVEVGESIREVIVNLVAARRRRSAAAPESVSTFQDRMANGLGTFDGPVLLILSGRDLTAKEFLEYAMSNPRWTGLLDKRELVRHEIDDADHTFSSSRWRQEVETLTVNWLRRSLASVPE